MINLTIWHGDRSSGISGDLDYVAEFVRYLQEDGAAITTVGFKPINHYIIGVGVGHDDADFAERGRSMAAYYENGESPVRDRLDYFAELVR